MLKQSEAFNTAFNSTERTLSIKIMVNDEKIPFTSEDIVSVQYDSAAYTGDTFGIGSTYENSIKVVFSELQENIKQNDILKPQIGIKLPDGTFEYSPLGVFIVSDQIEQDRNNEQTTVTAVDKMAYLEGTYIPSTTSMGSVRSWVLEIANMAGVPINEDNIGRLPTETSIASISKQTYRSALGMLAQFIGGYVMFNRSGELELRGLSDTIYPISPDNYEFQGLTKSETPYSLSGISCEVTKTSTDSDGNSSDSTISLHTGEETGSQVTLNNPSMTQSLLDDILVKLKGLNFYPYTLNWFGNPAVEAGDFLEIEDTKGNKFKVPNNSYVLTFDGSVSAVSSTSETVTNSSSYSYQGSLNQVLHDMNGRISAGGGNFVYTGTDEPAYPKENDIWYKDVNGKTQMYIYENGEWVLKADDLTGSDLQKQIDDTVNDVKNAQDAANDVNDKVDQAVDDWNKSKDEINDSILANQKEADDKIANANKAIEDANTSIIDVNKKISDANTAITNANNKALSAYSDAQDALNKLILVNSRVDNLSSDTQAKFDTLNNGYQLTLSEINNLQVGGRNYILGSEQSISMTGNGQEKQWNSQPAPYKFSTVTLDKLPIEDTQTAILSADYEITGTNPVGTVYLGFNKGVLWETNSIKIPDISKVSEKGRVFALMEGKKIKATPANLFSMRLDNVPTGIDIKFSNLKLEIATKPSDWTPAPEDMATQTQITTITGLIDSKVSQGQYESDRLQTAQQIADKVSNNDFNSFKSQTANSIEQTVEDINNSGQRNLVYNSEYENSAEGWTSTSNGYITTSPGSIYQGSVGWAVNLTSTTADKWTLFGQSKLYPLLNPTVDTFNTYSFSALVKTYGETGTNNYIDVVLAFFDASGSRVGSAEYGASKRDIWELVKKENVPIPANAKSVAIQYWARHKVAGQIHGVVVHPMITFGPQVGPYNPDIVSKSTITQLSNLIDSKVSDSKYQSDQLQMSNLISSKVSSTDFNSYKTQTDNLISSKVSQSDFDNLQVGGRNYLLGTGKPVTVVGQNKANQQIAQPVYKWSGGSIAGNGFKAGDKIIISVDWKAVDSTGNYGGTFKINEYQNTPFGWGKYGLPYKATGSDNNTTYVTTISKVKTSGHVDLYYVVAAEDLTNNGTGNLIRLDNIPLTTTLTFSHMKVVKSTTPGDWTPAPEDAASESEVTQLSNLIDSKVSDATYQSDKLQMSNLISSKVSSADFNSYKTQTDGLISSKVSSSDFNSYKTQTDKSISMKVSQNDFDNLQTGGINLLRNSNFADLTGKYWRNWDGATGATREINAAGDDWPANTPGLMKLTNPNGGQWGYAQDNIKVEPGAEYTISALVQGGSGVKVTLQRGNGSTDPWEGKEFTLSGGKNRISFAFKTGSTAKTTNAYVGFGNNGKGTVWISRIKLEEGNHASPWTAALDDLASATDYANLEIEVNGIQGTVANKADKSQVTQLADQVTSVVSDVDDNTSQITQMANDINLRVKEGDVVNQINVDSTGVLIDGEKVHITGQTTIDNGVIGNAAIGNLSADKITTGTINASNVNLINLNASSISTGTLTGSNLSLNLNTGSVKFQKGKIYSADEAVDIDIDKKYISVADTDNRILLKGGELQFVEPLWVFDPSTEPYLKIYNKAFQGGIIAGRDVVTVGVMGYVDGGMSSVGLQSVKGLFVTSAENGTPAALLGGGEAGIEISGGTGVSRDMIKSSPHIDVGISSSSGGTFGSNNIRLHGEHIYIDGSSTTTYSTYITPTSQSANMYIDANGTLTRSSSASKYKLNINEFKDEDQAHALLAISAKSWFDKRETEEIAKELTDGTKPESATPRLMPHLGFVAEDLANAGLEMLVDRGKDNQLEGINYDRISALEHLNVQELFKRVLELEREVYELRRNLNES